MKPGLVINQTSSSYVLYGLMPMFTSQKQIEDTVFLAEAANNEPKTFSEAIASPEANLWQEAIKSELDSLYENNTWSIVPVLPAGRKAIDSKWIFKKKLLPDGSVEQYK